jgi:hypothetical protein
MARPIGPKACRSCKGKGCFHCAHTGEERVRRQLTDAGEHPALAQLRAAGEAWARAERTPAARRWARSVLVYCEVVNYALGAGAGKGRAR